MKKHPFHHPESSLNIRKTSEKEKIAFLISQFKMPFPDDVLLGIGDDAAILAPIPGFKLVWTIDEQVEGQHFLREYLSCRDIGWRAYMTAASDLAAMGARGWCALSSIVLPHFVSDSDWQELIAGLREAAYSLHIPIVGGNLSQGSALSLATTFLGYTSRAISRGGGGAGDKLWLAGPVGLAAAGFRALQAGRGMEPSLQPAVAAWQRPQARLDTVEELDKKAQAAIDVSDGLAQDVFSMAEASQCQALLDLDSILEYGGNPLAQAAEALMADPLELALYGGEDYAIVAASSQPLTGFSCIGELQEGEGLYGKKQGKKLPLTVRGFDHFI
ncbi:thiamine-phosphate kinase [Pajaroellobacter abortibovis]|uniref:Thiamine-monophosphate kinase n=1 Tax=Pajaroellobacter abortibovis TaxID=1882918 RepID=A0A1L6MX94_9BACT|nr:thiamine-phosphate kinase [Pajaroellobacter abortibovis]APS00055.1 thiamine-phosphate kinase [Pajaroellobacter abortibovis]